MGTICSFSGIYENQEGFPFDEYKMISLKDISGCNGYCDPMAEKELENRLTPCSLRDIHLLDNGNYHYLTRIWLKKMRGAFELLVFDHHTDMQPSALLPVLSCGNWILECLKDETLDLKRVWLIGPQRDAYERIEEEVKEKIVFISQEEADAFTEDTKKSLMQKKANYPMYISIDKDVLSKKVLETNWDQGSMSTETLLKWLMFFREQYRIEGIDICGETENGMKGEKKGVLVNNEIINCMKDAIRI